MIRRRADRERFSNAADCVPAREIERLLRERRAAVNVRQQLLAAAHTFDQGH